MYGYNSPLLEVLKGLAPHQCAFLVGAGVSVDPPCGAPSGIEVTRNLIMRLTPNHLLTPFIERIAFPECFSIPIDTPILRFEHLVDSLMQIVDPHLCLLTYIYGTLKSNMLHAILSHICEDGGVILTTNYDSCIEQNLPTNKVVDLWSDGSYINFSKGVVVKLHGSIRGNPNNYDTSSLITSTRRLSLIRRVIFEGRPVTRPKVPSLGSQDGHYASQMFVIRPQTYKEIQNILDNRPLIVLGYSGMDDFDIVPILKRVPSKQPLVWIQHTKKGPLEVFPYESLLRRFKIAGYTFSKAEQVIFEVGRAARPPNKLWLIKGYSGQILSNWYGQEYVTHGQRLALDPLLDKWQISLCSPAKGGIALGNALIASGHTDIGALVLEETLHRYGDDLESDTKSTVHNILSTENLLKGEIKNASYHAAKAFKFASSDPGSRAAALTSLAFISMQLYPRKAIKLFQEVVSILSPLVGIKRNGRWTDFTTQVSPRLYIGALINVAILENQLGQIPLRDIWTKLSSLSRMARGFNERNLELMGYAERLVIARSKSPELTRGLKSALLSLIGECYAESEMQLAERTLWRMLSSRPQAPVTS